MLAETQERNRLSANSFLKPGLWEISRIRVSILVGYSTPCHGSDFGDRHDLAVRKKTPFIRYLNMLKELCLYPVIHIFDNYLWEITVAA